MFLHVTDYTTSFITLHLPASVQPPILVIEHLESFQIPTIINNAAINIVVVESLPTIMIR